MVTISRPVAILNPSKAELRPDSPLRRYTGVGTARVRDLARAMY